MRLLPVFALCLLVFCSGCGTTVSLVFPIDNAPVYKGVVFDAKTVKEGDVWFVLDMPFSLVGDTIVVPIELYEAIPPPNPVKGWASDNANQMNPAIIEDYQAYAHKVWPKDRDFFISEVYFYDDGTGRHAVKVVLEPALREYKAYYLIYDTHNVRIKVVKGGTYSQFHI